MVRKPWYKELFERDYYDYFYVGGRRAQFDEEERAKHAESQIDFIVGALGVPDGARILDLCCGWGRHSVRLARRGFDVTGVDLSAYHIKLAKGAAKEASVSIDFRRGDMREIPPDTGKFDAVINCFTSFGYFEDEEEDLRVLKGVRRALKPGGVFFIDTINRDNLMRVFRTSDWRERPDGGYNLERRSYDAKTGRNEVDWIYIAKDGERHIQSHSIRLYTFIELKAMMKRAGLAVRDAWGGFDGSDFTMYSPRMVVLAEGS